MRPLCFTAHNFINIEQICTQFGVNPGNFILNKWKHNLFESPSENKMPPSGKWRGNHTFPGSQKHDALDAAQDLCGSLSQTCGNLLHPVSMIYVCVTARRQKRWLSDWSHSLRSVLPFAATPARWLVRSVTRLDVEPTKAVSFASSRSIRMYCTCRP